MICSIEEDPSPEYGEPHPVHEACDHLERANDLPAPGWTGTRQATQLIHSGETSSKKYQNSR